MKAIISFAGSVSQVIILMRLEFKCIFKCLYGVFLSYSVIFKEYIQCFSFWSQILATISFSAEIDLTQRFFAVHNDDHPVYFYIITYTDFPQHALVEHEWNGNLFIICHLNMERNVFFLYVLHFIFLAFVFFLIFFYMWMHVCYSIIFTPMYET